ncbi:pimeloyl-ACP methyl ester carboxylesterase [Collimonas sp. PA-H2]|uniref:alpha/beta fold hydrolase n=1 Tax=Collimonas sp. PA-H2 TaxID=1881062 RepID=UPI000BF4100B|nr:alpha/beta hydrolase [Collimonas sp. PA-H2]PFH04596.1 pimeloyl-ACP methyl ester carboxylesterase [Collimonas sp. PA-H2]
MSMKLSRSEFIPLRGLRYHVRHWGRAGAPKIFMMHGWMDVSASFQFVVDCLQRDWHVIAPDWRGFGLTEGPPVDSYWFPDYLADLDAILQHYATDEAVNLLGHSMGGYAVGLYAGTRPQRIKTLINLEGFGGTRLAADLAPTRYAKWLDQLIESASLQSYPDLAAVAARLQKTNPRLSDSRAAFLAQHWARQNDLGRWEILADPAHKIINPVLPRVEEMLACWRSTTAPVLCVEAAETNMWQWMGGQETMREEVDRRIAVLPRARMVFIAEAGHMLHHDQPQTLAHLIEEFLQEQGAA